MAPKIFCPGVAISGFNCKSKDAPSLEKLVIVLAAGLIAISLTTILAVKSVALSKIGLSLYKIDTTGRPGFQPLKSIRNVKSVLLGSLSIIPTAIAPLFLAFVIFLTNVISPRSIMAILPCKQSSSNPS